jgi:predicted helicase
MSKLLVEQYHKEVEDLIKYGGSRNEASISNAFLKLLNEYCKKKNFILISQLPIKTSFGTTIIPDGTVKDSLRLDWGYLEIKDEYDTLDEEIIKKFEKGYPKDNILFEDTKVAVLFQGGREIARVQMDDTEALDRILTAFIDYERQEVRTFRDAIENFKEDIPQLAESLRILIDSQFENKEYIFSRDFFLELCKETINPDIVAEDIREMIIQHILTEDIFNTIFDETQFHRENNIARQLEEVISTFFNKATKHQFLERIHHYYSQIKAAASGIANHSEKQKFLKVIYENFYKAYSPKKADRLGVIYTPNEIVKFMIESADYLCYKHFGKLLSDKNVELLDPATGTGTYITELIEYMPAEKMKYKYEHEIHANEVAILPYYIANLNIEYTYKQKTGEYKEFKNICFVDTLDNVAFSFKGQQIDAFSGISQENKDRIKRQNERKISVIIGNPPYNANQMNENENNKNREYPEIDKRIKNTYIKSSTAQKTKVYDMYARFYRWSMDRLGDEGIIAFITNRSFINSRTFDGFRKTIEDEFDYVYIVDTRSDVRANPRIAGTTHNVFGIQTGVAVMFLVKCKD